MSLVEAYLRKKRGELLALRDSLHSVTLDEKTFHEFRHELERYRVSAPSAPRFEDFKGMKVIEYDGIIIQVASVFRKYGVVIWESEKSCGVDSLTSELFTMASKSYVDDIIEKEKREVFFPFFDDDEPLAGPYDGSEPKEKKTKKKPSFLDELSKI